MGAGAGVSCALNAVMQADPDGVAGAVAALDPGLQEKLLAALGPDVQQTTASTSGVGDERGGGSKDSMSKRGSFAMEYAIPDEEPDPEVAEFCECSKVPLFANPVKQYMMFSMVRRMVNGKVKVGDGKTDCTYAEVAEFEAKAWGEKPAEALEMFKAARPYSQTGYESKAPKVGDIAPDGPVLLLKEEGESTLLEEVRRAAGGSKFCGISFDSVTCPVWRSFAGYDFSTAAGRKGVPVLHVYTREAHGSDDFDAPPNNTGPLALTKSLPMHKTAAERRGAATGAAEMMTTQLAKEVDMVLDSMDDTLEKAWEARPFRFYIVEVETSKVVYASGLAPFNMPAKLQGIRDLST